MNFFIFLLMLSSLSWAEQKVAMIKMLRGEVTSSLNGESSKLKEEDWVSDGAVIKTAQKSFVKLVFIDKSQMNIGPSSEMRIERFKENSPGVIDLVKGKIRSQVTKDYLKMKDTDQSKLFIKTSNAVMGIRGTDFMITTNGINTSAVLFEGEVVFNKIEKGMDVSHSRLEEIVDRGVRLHPGEFSVVERDRPQPTIPSALNIQQKEALEKNPEFEAKRTPSEAPETTKSVVPQGLDGAVVSHDQKELKDQISSSPSQENSPVKKEETNPDGFVKGDQVKPANGSMLHVESGTVIPPSSSSVLDKNTNTYLTDSSNGSISPSGDYVPPKNIEITEAGKILVISETPSGERKISEIDKPKPVINGVAPLKDIPNILGKDPRLMNGVQPIPNDALNTKFNPDGVNDLSIQQRNTSGGLINAPLGTIQTQIETKQETNIKITPTAP